MIKTLNIAKWKASARHMTLGVADADTNEQKAGSLPHSLISFALATRIRRFWLNTWEWGPSKKMGVGFVLILLLQINGISAQSADSLDVSENRLNSIGLVVGGQSLGIGINYHRKIVGMKRFTLDVSSGVGLDLATLHWVSVPIGLHTAYGNRKIRPIINGSVVFSFGDELTYGYNDPQDFFSQECSDVGCAPWYPRTVIQWVGGIGLEWSVSSKTSVIATYAPSLLYNYYQTINNTTTHRFSHWAGISVRKHF